MAPRHNTRAGRSTQTLRGDAILSLRLAPGTRLVERDMVTRLGFSRTGVRAALQSPESEGLVARGHRGVFSVAAVSADEARQIYEVRAALEPAMARLFIARATEAEVAALGAAVARAEAAAHAQDAPAYVEAFRRFYDVLLAGTDDEIARASWIRWRRASLISVISRRWRRRGLDGCGPRRCCVAYSRRCRSVCPIWRRGAAPRSSSARHGSAWRC